MSFSAHHADLLTKVEDIRPRPRATPAGEEGATGERSLLATSDPTQHRGPELPEEREGSERGNR